MTTEQLARMMREIEINEMEEDTFMVHDSFDDLPPDLQDMYMKLAKAYQKHFNMEKKHDA